MHADGIAQFVEAVAPEHDSVQREMAAHGDREGFPTVGRGAGAALAMLTRLTDAERVFEFGSGFGYSASWFLRAGADRVVLTEHDADELSLAREYLGGAGYPGEAVYREGDAVEIVEEYDGPFSLAFVDHQKRRYVDAFERVRGKLRPGGAVVADNILAGPADYEAILYHLRTGEPLGDADGFTRGVAAYLDRVMADDAFETSVLPVGEGLTVSVRVD